MAAVEVDDELDREVRAAEFRARLATIAGKYNENEKVRWKAKSV